MGTNFYWVENPCPACGHGERYHIGKRSMGWRFSFQANIDLDIRSFRDWRKVLMETPGRIEDEYGERYDLQEFIEMVIAHCPDGKIHAELYPEYAYTDAEGYSFTDREFS